MKNETLYNKTVDILVQAYFNDTLEHGVCHACAVGNIINAHRPFSEEEIMMLNASNMLGDRQGWSSVFLTCKCLYKPNWGEKRQLIIISNYNGLAKEQIDSTGYSVVELAMIEHAFETAPEGNNREDYMFNGLMAVIDALDVIHENKDTEVTSSAKSQFILQTS